MKPNVTHILEKYREYVTKYHVGICPHGGYAVYPSTCLAHACIDTGEICFMTEEAFTEEIALHEVAHLIRGKMNATQFYYSEYGHDQRWAETLWDIGGKLSKEQQQHYAVEI